MVFAGSQANAIDMCKSVLMLFCLCFSSTIALAQNTKMQYFGQVPAGMTSSTFAPGIISLPDRVEFGSIYSRDGNEFYYAIEIKGKAEIRFMKFDNNQWSEPKQLMVHGEYSYNDPFLTPDEKRLFFISDRSLSGEGPKKDYDIWYIERNGTQWSKPVNAGPKINSAKNEYYMSFTKTGAIYFSSNVNGAERTEDYDIYTCRYADGEFQPAVRLGPAVNTTGYEADVYVNPDETYLIYCSNRPGTFGRGDLFISFRNVDGSWTPSKNMGKEVNEGFTEYCPFVTPDGKFLLFTAKGDIRWIDADIINKLK
jgi:Tol biopolymer transport system component